MLDTFKQCVEAFYGLNVVLNKPITFELLGIESILNEDNERVQNAGHCLENADYIVKRCQNA